MINSNLSCCYFHRKLIRKFLYTERNTMEETTLTYRIKPSQTNARDLSTNSDRWINAMLDNVTIMKVINSSITD